MSDERLDRLTDVVCDILSALRHINEKASTHSTRRSHMADEYLQAAQAKLSEATGAIGSQPEQSETLEKWLENRLGEAGDSWLKNDYNCGRLKEMDVILDELRRRKHKEAEAMREVDEWARNLLASPTAASVLMTIRSIASKHGINLEDSDEQ